MKIRIVQSLIAVLSCFFFVDAAAQGIEEFRPGPIEDAIIGGAIGLVGQERVLTIDEIILDFENEEVEEGLGLYSENEESVVIETPLFSFSTKILEIYPNPASNQVTIPFGDMGNYTIRLYDLSGRMFLQDVSLGTNVNTLDLTDVPEGLYLLHVESDTESKTHKLKVTR